MIKTILIMNLFKQLLMPGLVSALLVPMTSCRKENPKIHNYPEADFQIRITETRQAHDFIYNYDKSGGSLTIDEKEQKLQELWVTAWNDTRVEFIGTGAGFQGANISSSAPDVIKVIDNNDGSYSLKYMSDGSALIKAWTGDKYSYAFTVFAKERIELEGINMKYGEFDLIARRNSSVHHPYTLYSEILESKRIPLDKLVYVFGGREGMLVYDKDGRRLTEDSPAAVLTIGSLIPENASFRHVVHWYSRHARTITNWTDYVCVIPDENAQWPQGGFENTLGYTHLDWSEIQGRSVGVLLPGMMSSFAFLINNKVPDKELGPYKTAAGQTATYTLWCTVDIENPRSSPEDFFKNN